MRYDGPWDIPDALRKYNGVLRYSEGTARQRLRRHRHGLHQLLALDRPDRRCAPSTTGRIGRFGDIDPTDGGDSQRYSLSARWSRSDERTTDRVEAYVIYSTLNLYNNFTYFLNDPVNGDQFQQTDKRKS